MPRGGDWSGAPGHNCNVWGRRSENVEGHCRRCKRFIYMKGGKNCVPASSVDGYCGSCIKSCRICGEQIHPKYSDRYAVSLDKAIKDILDEDEPSIWLLGEDAANGETT
ncbi:hypothetical protein ACHAWO_008156 [Cyclotella atomus]|uniref:4Fe-4S ferredoxin-type domain-containing protein n=1 Tax=Cyclotella atomus TaxID=382360 RepID=A0ABD3PM90_9STRA